MALISGIAEFCGPIAGCSMHVPLTKRSGGCSVKGEVSSARCPLPPTGFNKLDIHYLPLCERDSFGG